MKKIIIDKGHFGKEDDDIMGLDVICVSNPDGFEFTEDVSYHISGTGGLEFEGGEWRTGFGKLGYNLVRESKRESFYIPHDILIRHFILSVDTMDDPFLIQRIKREMNIDEVLGD